MARADAAPPRFSDVVRELDLTQATAHAILKTLCDRGWATRDPVDKAFTLGPAAAVLAAPGNGRLMPAALAAVQRVAHECGYAGSVIERVGSELVITAYENVDGRLDSVTPGDRIPYAPPFGVAFAAWDTPDEQRAWMRRNAADGGELTARLQDVLARTRDRGFDVDWTTPALAQTAQLVAGLQRDGMPPHVREIMDQLLLECSTIGFLTDDDPARRAQPVATIAAPIFDRSGAVAILIAVHPWRTLTAKQITAVGRRLTDAAATVVESTAQA